MTYRYTDEQLNGLNRRGGVYSVDKNFAEKSGTKIVTSENNINPKRETNLVTAGGQEYRVVATENDDFSGFQGMAVAPIIDGQPDYQHVAVVAAGTDPKDMKDLAGAFNERQSEAGLSLQYDAAKDFVQEVNKKYRVTQLTGYSQGSYMLKVGAHFHIPTTVFNGWFDYQSLSDEEKEYLKNHPHNFVNYRHKNDSVVVWNDLNRQFLQGDYGTIHWVEDGHDSSHKIEDWNFIDGQVVDKQGNPVRSPRIVAYMATQQGVLQDIDTELGKLRNLKKELSTGGLDSGEQIFLDSEQALLLASSIERTIQAGLTDLIEICDEIITDAQNFWKETLREACSLAPRLSEGEVINALANGGASRESIEVAIFKEFTEKKRVAYQLQRDFSAISQDIRAGVQKQVETDQELARNFEQWDMMKNSIS